MKFKLHAPYAPAGDQPEAISQLVSGIQSNVKHQTLLGVTGSGKTFTMANVIEQVQMPTLIISHNKTLAAQLFQEFKEFFPDNAVEYFVSFYDYYQPEAYIPSTDTYIEKTSDINDEIDRLRLKATSSLMSRSDVIIIASVSCIYNIGSPDSYKSASMPILKNTDIERKVFLKQLIDMRYERNDLDFSRGKFRVRGDCIDIFPAYEETGLRLEMFGDTIERICRLHPVDGKILEELPAYQLFPAKHFVTSRVALEDAFLEIHKELQLQLEFFRNEGKLVEAQRLEQRTLYDIEMLREVGFISGIENYSRILDGREPGSRPHALIDFFSKPFLTIIDESHVSIPQIGGMFNGDRARKETLVNHGFRIPCALDNRPLRFAEFSSLLDNVVYVSATPADYELTQSHGVIVEQIIRPTGLIDPPITIKPATNQVDDLIEQLRKVVESKDRALVITLTKKMSEDLTTYLDTLGFKVRYLHSEIETLERSDILKELRTGVFDILIGINLLREGLDLPEVALVAILDADKEGFLRSTRSLIQIAGRAARHINGTIIFYADTETESIRKTVEECSRRRTIQLAYNKENNITPIGITSSIKGRLIEYEPLEEFSLPLVAEQNQSAYGTRSGPKGKRKGKEPARATTSIGELEKEMMEASKKLDFETAARIRDRIKQLRGEL